MARFRAAAVDRSYLLLPVPDPHADHCRTAGAGDSAGFSQLLFSGGIIALAMAISLVSAHLMHVCVECPSMRLSKAVKQRNGGRAAYTLEGRYES